MLVDATERIRIATRNGTGSN